MTNFQTKVEKSFINDTDLYYQDKKGFHRGASFARKATIEEILGMLRSEKREFPNFGDAIADYLEKQLASKEEL